VLARPADRKEARGTRLLLAAAAAAPIAEPAALARAADDGCAPSMLLLLLLLITAAALLLPMLLLGRPEDELFKCVARVCRFGWRVIGSRPRAETVVLACVDV
jgi:hypothetical protein